MTVKAEIIADSMSVHGIRLTTVRMTYPKFIHAELMTHRVFSRNAGSSRAIPVKKLLQFIREVPAEPMHWGLNEKGMQASQEATGWRLWALKKVWASARRAAVRRAWLMDKLGGHKQIVNRIIESHGHIVVLVTSTHWANFFALRNHYAAQPEIRELAKEVKFLMQHRSSPKILHAGEWHLPFITELEHEYEPDIEALKKQSVARCARTSYVTTDGTTPSRADDVRMYNRLTLAEPMHASPLEHVATPDRLGIEWEHREEWGNFYGWRQFRKMVPGEVTKEVFEQNTSRARLDAGESGQGSGFGNNSGLRVLSGDGAQSPGEGDASGNPSGDVVAKNKRSRKAHGRTPGKKDRRKLSSNTGSRHKST